jgi:predicted NBD/HSP70 family sugar kinase
VKVLVIDVGGTNVKLTATDQEVRRFESGRDLTPEDFVAQIHDTAADWAFDAVSIGLPTVVGAAGPFRDPVNLGDGWVGFDFRKAFGKPVRVVNDAVLQALGGYDGGRMLFLGLGTGLGTALISEHVAIPLELGCLLLGNGQPMHERLGKQGLETLGEKAWVQSVHEAVDLLQRAFVTDYILLGGGNAERVDPLPRQARRGGNEDALKGGFMLWEEEIIPHDRRAADTWRVIR